MVACFTPEKRRTCSQLSFTAYSNLGTYLASIPAKVSSNGRIPICLPSCSKVSAVRPGPAAPQDHFRLNEKGSVEEPTIERFAQVSNNQQLAA